MTSDSEDAKVAAAGGGWVPRILSVALWTQVVAMTGASRHSAEGRTVVRISLSEQRHMTQRAHHQCLEQLLSRPLPSGSHEIFCPGTWDEVMCWPDTPAGEVAVQPCPDYVNGFRPWENATRQCLQDGSWYFDPAYNRTWTDLRFCTPLPDDDVTRRGGFIKSHMNRIRLMYNTGYGVSLASLIVSLVIMLSFKRLHCPRNYIHVNLFISFTLRASISFMKENLLVDGVGFPGDVTQDGQHVLFNNGSVHWECKLFFTCFHYILGANYIWILVEALYLHVLIFSNVLPERSSVRRYVLLGWVSPILFMAPWVIVRAVLEDTLCWNTNPTSGYFWIMKGPIVASIVINFILFLNIIRVLYTKLNAQHSPAAKKYKYRKLAKSTLVLIPLFGIHYIVFVWLPKDLNPEVELIRLYFDMFFNSVQGFLVALLFCFLNGEVQNELRKLWLRVGQVCQDVSPKCRHTMTTSLSQSHNLDWSALPLRPPGRDPYIPNNRDRSSASSSSSSSSPPPPRHVHISNTPGDPAHRRSGGMSPGGEVEPMIHSSGGIRSTYRNYHKGINANDSLK